MKRALLALAALLLASIPAYPQSNPCNINFCATRAHYLSAASTNSTSVKASAGAVYSIVAVNTTATLYYLKFYDKAAAPTCASDTVVMTIPVPASATGGPPVQVSPQFGIGFANGIGFCLTGGLADNDNTNAASGVAINIVYR